MSRIDEIIAKQKELAEELELAKQQERDAVLKDIKEKIKMFDFKASDFKGMFKSRVTQKQVEEFLKRKEADKSKPKAAAKKTSK
jgi:23S rRNA A1618 N6-methylase RlmF